MKLKRYNFADGRVCVYCPKSNSPTVTYLNRCLSLTTDYNDFFFNPEKAIRMFG